MNLYLDDDSDSNLLIAFLTKSAHRVISPRSAGTSGVNDKEHLLFASRRGCALISYNCDDYMQLHQDWLAAGRSHAGIFVIYRDNDPTKDMRPRDILRAINHIELSGLPLQNGFFKLNEWQ